MSGVLRDHLAVLEAAKQRAAALRAKSGASPEVSSASALMTTVSSTPQISGVLRDYLATKQAALTRQLDTSSAAQQSSQPQPAGSSGPPNDGSAIPSISQSSGVLKDYVSTIRARQAGQSQSDAKTSQAYTGMDMLAQIMPVLLVQSVKATMR